ncbi:hypothetical protein [Cohnella nanjingensis]|uniref:Heparin-sulfate lyase N-terminal domain-containing protein n=1 Tax=Cohnella nanjingensis TaxID=1387779 RepID=A0A7X0RS77_9BACL|nr:hypothetical protein [Cohnella nanjingensis]MBB6672734.1 hypothetical protein [Cohnella nanjingensis]
MTEHFPDQRPLLIRQLRAWEESFDEEIGLLKLPFHSPGYHTTLTAEAYPLVHPTYPSSLYAVALLDSGLEQYEQRAFAVIGRLLTLQDRDREKDTYGIWPWFYEEPLARMSPPDWNWADFIGKQLVLAALRHGRRLPDELRQQVREGVICACEAIVKRDVGPHYTNIAIMGAFVTLIAGELYDRRDFADYGLRRLEKLHRYTERLGTFQEFNSPPYSVIAIVELSKIQAATGHSRAKELAADLLDGVWRMVAEHFHPASKQWSGPHSRSYGTVLTDKAKSFLQLATGNELVFFPDDDLPYDVDWYASGFRCPEKYAPLFVRQEERSLKTRYFRNEETGFEKWADTYMTPGFSIGVFREEIMWNQTRGLIAFFDNGGEATYLRLRCLHDGYDYCSAVLSADADNGHYLLGVHFLANGGDTHPGLDRIDGFIEASDLRLRMEIGGALDRVAAESNGRALTAAIGPIPIKLQTLFASFHERLEDVEGDADRKGWRWEIAREEEALCADLVLYSGVRKTIDFRALRKAAFLFSFSVGEASPWPQIAVEEQGERVTAIVLPDERNALPRRLSVVLRPKELTQ